jgi:hypothetical protein
MAEGPGSRRIRLLITPIALAVGLGVPSAGVARSQADVLAVSYVGSTSLQVRAPDGSIVRSGGTLPAGSYSLQVDDPDYTNPSFQMSGPGVNVSSNLDSTGMGIDRPAFLGSVTLQLNASYKIQDANIGASSAITFTAVAGASTPGGSTGGTTTTSGGSSSGGGSTGGTGGSSGSTTTKLVGTIKASVSATGKPALSFGGKAVKTLKKGRYMFTVADHSKKAALIVWPLGRHAIMLSGAATIGSSSHSVTLSAGKWFFEAFMSGPRTYFTVTG